MDKNENKFQIEFANQMKKKYIKLHNLNFCYKFESVNDNQQFTTVNQTNISTIVVNNNFQNRGINDNIYNSNNSNYNDVVFYKNYS